MPFEKNISRTKNPFEIYLLFLSLVAVIPLIVGVAPPPASIDSQVGPVYSKIWAFFLLIGAIVSLVGIFWPQPKNSENVSVTGLIFEQTGLVAVSGATVYYSAVLLIVLGTSALINAAIILAFGLASAVQAYRINRYLRDLEPS